MDLISKNHFLIKMLAIYLVILYRTNQYYAMIEIHHGLMKRSNLLYPKKNTAFRKFRCDGNNNLIKRQLNTLQERIITLTEASK